MPGLTALTRILRGASSFASTAVIRSTDALVAPYTAVFGIAIVETPEEMLTTLPPSLNCRAAACVTSSRPSTLTSNWRWKCSGVIASSAPNS